MSAHDDHLGAVEDRPTLPDATGYSGDPLSQALAARAVELITEGRVVGLSTARSFDLATYEVNPNDVVIVVRMEEP